jgi:hypothetical protein
VLYGQVISASDQMPIEGVQVLIQGTTMGTSTNGQGVFRLAESTQDTVVVQFSHPCHFPVTVLVPRGEDTEVSVGIPLNRRSLRDAGCGGRGRWDSSR